MKKGEGGSSDPRWRYEQPEMSIFPSFEENQHCILDDVVVVVVVVVAVGAKK